MAVQVQAPPARRAVLRPEPAGTGPRWLIPALLTTGLVGLVGCLLLGNSMTTDAVAGLPDAGSGTRWGLPVASFIAETALVLAFGAALLVAALMPTRRSSGHRFAQLRDFDTALRAHCLRTAGYFAGLAAVASLVGFVLTVSDLTARPLPGALSWLTITEVAAFGPGLLLLISAALAAAGFVLCLRAARRLTNGLTGPHQAMAVLSTVVLATALIPWALGGHTAQAGQDIAASSLIVHVLAAGAWIGGLTIIVLFVRGELLTQVLPRFSTLALWCWISIGVSGVITGWLRIGQVSDLWTSGYGRLLLIKLLCLSVLGAFGAWHRRRLAAGLRTMRIGQRGALLRVAAVEVLVMGATMGVATALSATAPPAGHATGHDAAHGTSRIEGLAGHRVPVISAENLALLWRPDVLVLLLVAVALTCYLAGTRRARMTGGRWPASRICWAVAAATATVLALNSGVATYDGVVWSVTVTQQAITSMFIPLAIVLARPWELFAEHGVVHRTIDGLSARPWAVLAVYAIWSAACLLTPIALWSVSNHAVLMATRVGDIVIGTALFTVLLASSRPARATDRRTASPIRLLFGWFAIQIGIAAALLFGGAAAARPWFSQLNLAWISVADDEQKAAIAHFGIAIGVLLLAAALPTYSAPARKPADSVQPRNLVSPGRFENIRTEIHSEPIATGDGSESPSSSTSITPV